MNFGCAIGIRLAELATDRRSAGWDVAGRDCARAGAIRVSSKPAFTHDCSESDADSANDGGGALILWILDGVLILRGEIGYGSTICRSGDVDGREDRVQSGARDTY